MKFIKISAFAIVLLLLMQIVSKAFIAIDSSDIENIYGFYAEPENSLDMVMIGPSEVYTGYAPALAWEEYGLKSCNLSIGAVPCNMYKSIVTEIVTGFIVYMVLLVLMRDEMVCEGIRLIKARIKCH